MFRTPLLLAALWCLASFTSAQPLDARRIAKEIGPSLVEIRARGDGFESRGSGFLVSPDGKIVTCLHVIADADHAGVRLPNGEVMESLGVFAFNEALDLAIIGVQGDDLPTVVLGDSSGVEVGEAVLVIGNPYDLTGSVTTGVISGIRELEGGHTVFQTDAAANPGSSGGPLVDSHGTVVGLVSFKLRRAENLNFAVPVNQLKELLATARSSPLPLNELGTLLRAQRATSETTTEPTDPSSILENARSLAVVQPDGNPELLAAVQQELIKWHVAEEKGTGHLSGIFQRWSDELHGPHKTVA